MFINILPPNTRLKIRFRSSLRRYTIIWSIASACALVCIAFQFWKLHQTYVKRDGFNGQCEPLYTIQRAMHEDQQELDRLSVECRSLERLQPSDHLVDLLGILSGATRSETGKLQIQRMSLQKVQNAPDGESATKQRTVPATKPTNESTMLSLQGVADDDGSLSRFVAGLRSVGVFDSVVLKSSSQIASGSRTARQYQLECFYKDQP